MAVFGFLRFPVVEPDFGQTKLRLAREGLDAIRRIISSIAAIAFGRMSSSNTSLTKCRKGRSVYRCPMNWSNDDC